MTDLKEGCRVRLKPDEKEGWPEEFGTFIGRSEMKSHIVYVVVDKKYRPPHDSDGLREMDEDQIELI